MDRQKLRGGGLRAEVDIGLVHHHGLLRMCVQQRCDLCAAQRDPGWSIWVWDDDGSARTRIVCDADVKRCVEWHRVRLNAEQPAVGGVEAVCDIGKQKRRVLL